MSSPEAISYDPRAVPPLRQVRVRIVVAAARLLATQSPQRIRAVLTRVSTGARPSTCDEAAGARLAVVSVSLACAGREGCLTRSLATAMLCRWEGHWPTWCLGARRLAPFYAHAWVEAGGVMIGEDYPADYFRTLFAVPAGRPS